MLVTTCINGVAQHSDVGLWMSINAEKKITRFLSVSLSEELRLADNISAVGTSFTEAGINLKLIKNFRLSAMYRFTLKQTDEGAYSRRHRYYFDLSYRQKMLSFTFILRTRFQSQYADVYSSPEGTYAEYYSRNRITVKYEINKKIRPYVCAELFTPISNGNGLMIDDGRYSGGVEYSVKKRHVIDLFYMLQQEYNVNNPETDHIMGIGYYFNF